MRPYIKNAGTRRSRATLAWRRCRPRTSSRICPRSRSPCARCFATMLRRPREPDHRSWWTIVSPKGGGAPTGELRDAITGDFGSVDAFKKQFDEAAMKRFGSGWAWLGRQARQSGSMHSTANAGLAGHRRGDPDHRTRCLGARLLSEKPEPARRLRRRILGGGGLGAGGKKPRRSEGRFLVRRHAQLAGTAGTETSACERLAAGDLPKNSTMWPTSP